MHMDVGVRSDAVAEVGIISGAEGPRKLTRLTLA
jgi:hypothetical protein